MVLGLSGDVWTALGSIAALLGLLLSAWSLRRRSDNASIRMTPEAPGVTPAAEKLDWPPDIRLDPAPSSIGLRRTDSGSSLLDIIGSAAMYQLDHDEPATAEEADQIADAFSTIHNWAETGDEVDPGDRVRASFELTELLEELGKAGWSVYAATTSRNLVVADKAVAWPTATIHIARTKQAEAA